MGTQPGRRLFGGLGLGPGPRQPDKGSQQQSALLSKWRELPLATRRKALLGFVIFLYVVVIGGGVFYNVLLLTTLNADSSEVDHRVDGLATMPLLRSQILEAQRTTEELTEQHRDMFRLLPDWTTVPLVVEWLESVGDSVGGKVLRVDYSPPRWQAGRGTVPMSLEYVGDFQSVVHYLAVATAGLPSLAVNQASVVPVGATGEELRLLAVMTLDVLEARPAGARPWDPATSAAAAVSPGRSPFAPPPGLWSAARRAGLSLPELRVQGIARAGDERLAVLVLDGQHHVVRSGTRLGDVLVVRVDPEAVVVQVGTRQATLALRE